MKLPSRGGGEDQHRRQGRGRRRGVHTWPGLAGHGLQSGPACQLCSMGKMPTQEPRSGLHTRRPTACSSERRGPRLTLLCRHHCNGKPLQLSSREVLHIPVQHLPGGWGRCRGEGCHEGVGNGFGAQHAQQGQRIPLPRNCCQGTPLMHAPTGPRATLAAHSVAAQPCEAHDKGPRVHAGCQVGTLQCRQLRRGTRHPASNRERRRGKGGRTEGSFLSVIYFFWGGGLGGGGRGRTCSRSRSFSSCSRCPRWSFSLITSPTLPRTACTHARHQG